MGNAWKKVLFFVVALLFLTYLSGANGVTCVPTPDDSVCAVKGDCEGLPHLNCPGYWVCAEGQCVWECKEQVEYTLHEWGVFKTGGIGAEVSTTPAPYMGPVPAKPIIYLYSEQDFDLDVAVDFASGTATEVWPEIPMSQSIEWNGVQVAAGSCETTPFPIGDPMGDGGPTPEVTQLGPLVVDEAACLTFGDVVSKLLFYTGQLPDYKTPLEVSYEIDSEGETLAVELTNSSAEAVENVMVVYRQVDSECIDPSGCWVHCAALAHGVVDLVPAGGAVAASLDLVQVWSDDENMGGGPELPPSWLGQAAELEAYLLEMGLSPAEADAFMVAWIDVFFGVMSSAATFFEPEYSDGFFVIYPMSGKTYDEQLKLTVSAEPSELVRVGYVYQSVPVQACMPAQKLVEGACQCKEIDNGCTPWCDPADPNCVPGTWNEITCECDPSDNVW